MAQSTKNQPTRKENAYAQNELSQKNADKVQIG